MRKDACEMDQFMEKIKDRAAFGATSPRDYRAVFPALLINVFCTMIGFTTSI